MGFFKSLQRLKAAAQISISSCSLRPRNPGREKCDEDKKEKKPDRIPLRTGVKHKDMNDSASGFSTSLSM
ncbi:hypothetical protein EYF80_021210 [Liparis tanakae]|uniref:Uncharacterized protein n=1 Tax=Liparis tanakae TaxID=230148 RepID=A0A4Z2HU82_9TELE|nr:hypothetical protein EYF80_021210 [Liparis tanakae]